MTHAENYTAILAAWMNPGTHPGYHRAMQAEVHRAMPVLAAALERAALNVTRQQEGTLAGDETTPHRDALGPGGEHLTP